MANFQIPSTLTFAGVPFFPDSARSFASQPGPNDSQRAWKKQQPEPELLAEVNRFLDMGYLDDFALPGSFPGLNVSALARQKSPGSMPSPMVHIGDWYYPRTASKWSVFRGLATSSQVQAMVAACGAPVTIPSLSTNPSPSSQQTVPNWGPAEFIMSAPYLGAPLGLATPDNYTLTTPMFMLPPRPLAEHGGQFDGLYLVTLVDERYWWQYASVTTTGIKENSSWDELIDSLAADLNVTIDFHPTPAVYGQPEQDSQLWANQESSPVLLDAVAMSTGRTLVRNLNGSITLQSSEIATLIVAANRQGLPPSPTGLGMQPTTGNLYSGIPYSGANFPDIRLAGGEIFSTNSGTRLFQAGDLSAAKNAAVPNVIQVTFPQYIYGDDPVPHFVNPRYQPQRPSAWYEQSYGAVSTASVPISSGGPYASGILGTSGYSHTIRCTAKALYSGEVGLAGDPDNASGLLALSMALAKSHYTKMLATALDEVFPGTYAWQPEALHDIVWRYSEKSRLASTRILRTQWNNGTEDVQNSLAFSTGNALPFDMAPGDVISGYGQLSGFVNTTGGTLASGTIISGTMYTDTPRGVGGPSVAQTWRDSFSGTITGTTSGFPTVNLVTDLINSGVIAGVDSVSCLPTQQRWGGRIDNEAVLFEGTSGGIQIGAAQIPTPDGGIIVTADQFPATNGFFLPTSEEDTSNSANIIVQPVVQISGGAGLAVLGAAPVVPGIAFQADGTFITSGTLAGNSVILASGVFISGTLAVQIVYRGLAGTFTVDHFASGNPDLSGNIVSGGTVTWQGPDTIYGANLIRQGAGQLIFPGAWTSGGIQEVIVAPQTQTVRALAGSGALINGVRCFSGIASVFDSTQSGLTNQLQTTEPVWLVERTGLSPASGRWYGGQFVGYSASGMPAPIYLVSDFSGGGSVVSGPSIYSGVAVFGFSYSGGGGGQFVTRPDVGTLNIDEVATGTNRPLTGLAIKVPNEQVAVTSGKVEIYLLAASGDQAGGLNNSGQYLRGLKMWDTRRQSGQGFGATLFVGVNEPYLTNDFDLFGDLSPSPTIMEGLMTQWNAGTDGALNNAPPLAAGAFIVYDTDIFSSGGPGDYWAFENDYELNTSGYLGWRIRGGGPSVGIPPTVAADLQWVQGRLSGSINYSQYATPQNLGGDGSLNVYGGCNAVSFGVLQNTFPYVLSGLGTVAAPFNVTYIKAGANSGQVGTLQYVGGIPVSGT